jgi:LL-H family phage holin
LIFVDRCGSRREGLQMEEIKLEIINLVVTVLVACVGIVTRQVVKYLKGKGLIAQLENNKELVKIVVNAVEQTYKTLHGEEKLNVAKLEVVKLMNEKKIKISEKEIDLLIEASVKEMKDAVKEEIKR